LGKRAKTILPVIPALVVYALLAYHLDFYQDDAYISYRYVANYLNGDGLVYNIGEHVEGFTNFGWILYMLLWGALGANYVLISKVTGFVLGGGIVILTYLIARRVFGGKAKWLAVGTTYLVGLNQSLAYWSPAGLETAAFAFCAMLCLYFYLGHNWLLISSLAYAVLFRPEGAMVAGLLIMIEFLQTRKLPFFTLASAAAAFIMLLPFVGFKLGYYGSILPNPFYAKTSFDFTQLNNGLEYAGQFFSHYGFYGIGLAVPLLLWRKLSGAARAVWLYVVLYTVYIILIGGDVLKVHRFFLPLFGPVAILILLSLELATRKLSVSTRQLCLIVAMIPLLLLTYILPGKFVGDFNFYEKAFTRKMQFKAKELLKSDPSDFSVALATIGIFGYELVGHDIIDMVGLTDTTIARYSEEPIEGMMTTWKEQKHNSRYILERAPDYIMFSTGLKPSAPAEKALLLYPQFLRSYRTVAWPYRNPAFPGPGVMTSVFKKVRPIVGEIRPTYPVRYVEEFKLGMDAYVRGDHRTALRHYDRALAVSPRPYNLYLLYQKAFSHIMLKQDSIAEPLLNAILGRDSMIYEVHKELYVYSMFRRNRDKAEIHQRWLQKLVPWYFPELDSLARQMVRRTRLRW